MVEDPQAEAGLAREVRAHHAQVERDGSDAVGPVATVEPPREEHVGQLGLAVGLHRRVPALVVEVVDVEAAAEVRPSIGRLLGKQDRRQLRVLYQDDAVVVLNKPPKMLAVPTDHPDLPSALALLSEQLKSKRQQPFVVHRIDRDTSGILLFAKTWPDREALVQQFIHHTPVREYLAVVRGHLRLDKGTLVHHFRQEGMFQRVTTESDPEIGSRWSCATRWYVTLRAQRSSESHCLPDCKIKSVYRCQRSDTRSSATRSTIQPKRRNGELLASLCTPPILGSFTRALETLFRFDCEPPCGLSGLSGRH